MINYATNLLTFYRSKSTQGHLYLPIFAITAIVFVFALTTNISAQTSEDPDIELYLTLDEQLNKAQVIGLTTLGIDRRGRGKKLAQMELRNNETTKVENLYFNIVVESNKHGEIANAYQENGSPFSLDANQVVVTNNNMVQDGIPQIEQNLYFDAELTESGENLYNELEGSTQLPSDVYTLTVTITQNENQRYGGTPVAQASATIGSTPSVDMRDIFLQTPGAEVGGGETVTTSYPEFAWDGSPNAKYRLIVVEDNGSDSPESLIQSAKSSDPTLENGSTGSGSLLEFEHVDATIDRTTFQYPSSGVQALESGKTYYWQTIALIQGASQVQEISSEIWEFTARTGTGQNQISQNEELQNMLKRLLGPEQYNQLRQQSYRLEAITIEGQTLEGPSAMSRLSNFMKRVESGDVTVTVEQ